MPQDMLEGFKALVDLTGTLSDAMDELGIVGVVPAYVLPPVNTGTRIVGPGAHGAQHPADGANPQAPRSTRATRKAKAKRTTSPSPATCS